MSERKRSGKFYSQNEKEVMSRLGLKPTAGSGSGWIEKEDGQNDYIIAQLKSTDAQSIRVSLLDLQKLEYHAITSHKIPVFVIQFLETNELFVMAKPADLPSVSKYLECGKCDIIKMEVPIAVGEETNIAPKKVIKSGTKGREKFWAEKEKEREQWRNKKK